MAKMFGLDVRIDPNVPDPPGYMIVQEEDTPCFDEVVSWHGGDHRTLQEMVEEAYYSEVDPAPKPTDGPEYHADLAFWQERQDHRKVLR